MKRFIRNLEKEYLAIIILVLGILMIIFPGTFARISPWVLGAALIVRAAAVIVLAVYYRDPGHGPGKAILYTVMALTLMIHRNEATGIIGVVWAVFVLMEVSEEINEMWQEKHCSVIHLILAAVSVALAVMLMVDPFGHFVTQVRILGLEIVSSCLARGIDMIKARIGRNK